MNLANELETALHDEAARYSVRPGSWDEIVTAAVAEDERRRRRRVLLLGGVAATLFALVASVVVWQRSDDRAEVRTVEPGPSRPTPTTGTGEGLDPSDRPSTTAAVLLPPSTTGTEAAPRQLIARAGDSIVVVDPSTGRRTRTIVREADLGGDIGWPTLTADHGTLYVSVDPPTEGCGDEIWAVPIDRPERRTRIAEGSRPAISRDGSRLAYFEHGRQGCMPSALAVRDMRTGGVVHRAFDDDELWENQGAIAWLSTGEVVLVQSVPEGPGELFRVPAGARTMADAIRLGPPGSRPSGTGWYSPQARAHDGLVAVLEACCALDAGSYDGGNSLVVADPATGAVRGRMPLDFSAASLAYDDSGRHVAVVDGEGAIRVRSGAGAFRQLPGDGYRWAIW